MRRICLSDWSKKGLQEYLSVWWMVLIVIAIGSIAIGVIVFYSGDLDTRKFDSDILNGNIENCIFDKGELKSHVLEDDFNIFSECGLSENFFESENKFYFEISFYDFNSNEMRKKIVSGELSFATECNILFSYDENIKAEHFPRCSSKEIEFSEGKVRILTASNQEGEKITGI